MEVLVRTFITTFVIRDTFLVKPVQRTEQGQPNGLHDMVLAHEPGNCRARVSNKYVVLRIKYIKDLRSMKYETTRFLIHILVWFKKLKRAL